MHTEERVLNSGLKDLGDGKERGPFLDRDPWPSIQSLLYTDSCCVEIRAHLSNADSHCFNSYDVVIILYI